MQDVFCKSSIILEKYDKGDVTNWNAANILNDNNQYNRPKKKKTCASSKLAKKKGKEDAGFFLFVAARSEC